MSTMDELGKRAVACKHFYWMPGMLLSNGRRVGVWTGGVCGSSESEPPYDNVVSPDLSDPATLGCLLHLVREAWEEAAVYVEHDKCRRRPWVAILPMLVIDCDTEAEALVAALEAAP